MSRQKHLIVPPPVLPGSRIAVIAPGSPVSRGKLKAGLATLESWGYEPVEGPHLWCRAGDLAGDDEGRLSDLEWALTDSSLAAVWAARGGWGTPRLLPRLSPRKICAASPRWVIGFSDLTALLLFLLRQGIASWHAPLVSELADKDRYSKNDLLRMLRQPSASKGLGGVPLTPGKAEGSLAGGCLTLLAWLAGTPWQPDLRGKILFLEEVGEAPYRIDRMLHQLRSSGLLSGIVGLAFGQFVECDPPPGRSSRRLREVLKEHAREIGVPALIGVPFGHGRKARALPLGFPALLDAEKGWLSIEAPRA